MASIYAEQLCCDSRTRYFTKINTVNGIDPYSLKNLNSSLLPPIEATDLVNYLVLGTSPYTSEQFKSYRSLEAYNQFNSGWVQDVGGCVVNDKYIVVSKVGWF